MKNFYCLSILLFSFCILQGCGPENSSNTDIKAFWKDFVKNVRAERYEEMKESSLPKIYCKECLGNTAEERDAINIIKITDLENWNDNLSEMMAYIPVDTFIKGDFNKIFNSDFKARLKKTSNITFFKQEFEANKNHDYLEKYLEDGMTYQLHEIMVTTEDASTQAPAKEKIIQVLETKEGLKFYGYISSQ